MELANIEDVSKIHALVKEIKEEMVGMDPYSFVSPSAYDTAWLAMINNPLCNSAMFKDCLDWVLNNQAEEGYWGECDAHGNLTIVSLPATLACLIALKKWNIGNQNIKRGTYSSLSAFKPHCFYFSTVRTA